MWIECKITGKISYVPMEQAKRDIGAGLATRVDDARIERLQASIVVHSSLND